MLPDTEHKRRIEWLDCARGIVILLVIVGHTVGGGMRGKIVRGLIASFHMPFFFIVSGYAFKPSESLAEFYPRVRRLAKKLLLPFACAVVIKAVIDLINDGSRISNPSFWMDKLYLLTAGNCKAMTISDISISNQGFIWFFPAMFFARTAYDYIQVCFPKERVFPLTCMLSMIGFCVGQQTAFPLSMDIAFVVLPLYHFGFYLKKGMWGTKGFVAALLIWLFALWLTFPDFNRSTYLDLAYRRYPLYPICFIASAAGSMVAFQAARCISRWKTTIAPLLYLGKNTIYFLLIHYFDYNWKFLWNMPEHEFVAAARRILADIIIFVVFMLIKNGISALVKAHSNHRIAP